MHILLAQIPCIEGDIATNLATIENTWHAAERSADLIVFPELQLTGFAEHGHTTDRALQRNAEPLQRLQALSRQYNQAAAIGFLENDNGRIFNTTAFITPEDGIRCSYRKTHLWDTERHLIDAGNEFVVTQWRGARLGFITCFDIEFPETARCTAALDCDILLVCDGNMDPYLPVHQLAARTRAMENQIFVCLTNRCGGGMGLNFSGASLAADPNGNIIAEAKQQEAQTLSVHIDTQQLADAKREYDYLQQRRVLPHGQRLQVALADIWRLS